MARFTSSYSAKQREAVLAAAFDRQPPLSGAKIAAAAAAGQLGVAAFTIPTSTVHAWVGAERRRREQDALPAITKVTPGAQVEELRRRLAIIADRITSNLLNARRPAAAEARDATRFVEALARLDAITNRPPPPTQPAGGRNGTGRNAAADRHASFLDGLAAEHAQQRPPTTNDQATTHGDGEHTTPEGAAGPAGRQANSTTATQADDGVSAREGSSGATAAVGGS